MIRLGLPKGRMMADAARFCAALGVDLRSGVLHYRTAIPGAEVAVYLLKAPDVAGLLSSGQLDLGLAGDEWLMEADVSPNRRCFEVRSYAAALCLLTAAGDPRPTARLHRIATPYPRLARRLLAPSVLDPVVVPVRGSSEALVPDVADACVDLVETGRSAELNGLVVRQRFGEVTTHLARSDGCDPAEAAPVVELLSYAAELTR